MSERQADVRDEGTPVSVPAQKLPTVAPERDNPNAPPAVPLEGGLEDKPQVRGKGPKGRERRPGRARTGKSRAAPAKPKGPARASKKGVKKAGSKTGAQKAGTKAGTKKAGARKAGARKAGGRKAAPARAGAQNAFARKTRKDVSKATGERKDSGGSRPRKSLSKKAVSPRGAVKKAGGRSPTQGGRGATGKGKRRT